MSKGPGFPDITTMLWAVFFILTWPFFAIFFLVVAPIRWITGAAIELPAWQEWKAKLHTNKLHKNVTALETDILTREEFGAALYRLIQDYTDDDTADAFIIAAMQLYDMEGLNEAIPPPPAIANSIEAGRYRDWLAQHAAKIGNPRALVVLGRVTLDCLKDLAISHVPVSTGDDLTVRLTDVLPNVPELVENVAMSFYDSEAVQLGVFDRLRKELNRNLCEVSGLPAITANYDSSELVMPTKYKGDRVAYAYLKHTPLLQLFDLKIGYAIPGEARYEGQWIVAPQGTGKTQFIQYQISKLIPRVVAGKASIIVMDSKEQMIRTLSHVRTLKDHLVLIDANDVEYPLALNLFDLGQSGNLSLLEQERQLNTALEVVGFMLDSLLGSDLTSKQQVVFRYLTQAMLTIPNATILTFQDLLQHGTGKYQKHIDTLEGAALSFFADQFNSRQFAETRNEINRRLYGILGIRAWERMFTQPQTKLDLFAEMNAGKVICINTAKSLLQPKGCEAFGRFFLALITMAAQRRATLDKKAKIPCHVFIDEFYDYAADANISTIIEQCREQKIALTVAHQNCSQLSQRVLDTLQTVAIKCASSLSNRDAHMLAPGMRCKPEMLTDQPRGTFAVYVRNVTQTAVTTTVPFGALEDMERTGDGEYEALKKTMREKYAKGEIGRQETDIPAAQPSQKPDQPTHEEAADMNHRDRTASISDPHQTHGPQVQAPAELYEFGFPYQDDAPAPPPSAPTEPAQKSKPKRGTVKKDGFVTDIDIFGD